MIAGSGAPAGSDNPVYGASAEPSKELAGKDQFSIEETTSDDSILELLTEAQKVELHKQIEMSWQIANASKIKWMNDRQEGLQLYWGIRRPRDFPFRNCLSKDTEILTKRGWINICDVTLRDHALTRRDSDGGLEWNAIEALPRTYAERLVHFKSHSMDIMATPDHEMIVRNQKGVTKRMSALKLANATGYRIPLSGSWIQKSPQNIFGLDAKDVAEFMGWFLSEGSYNTQPNGYKGTIQIAQSETANHGKCERLKALFQRLGFSWSYNRHSFTIHLKSMPQELVDIVHCQGGCAEKHIPAFFFTMGKDVASSILEGLILGDGCRDGYGNETFYTTSSALADGVQALALYCGKRATIIPREPGSVSEIRGNVVVSIKTGYVVRFCSRLWAKVDAAKKTLVDYYDYAYCVTVKNHSIYVRRNGIASFVGNCANVHVPLVRTIMDTLHSNIMGSMDPNKPASIVPVGPEDVPKAKKAEKLLNWQFSTQVDYLDLVDRAVHSALLYGVAPIKLRYVIERENGKKVYDGLKYEVLPPERLLTPPDASSSDVNEMDYVLQEVSLSKSDLKKRMLSGMYAWLSEDDLNRIGENITKHRRHFDDFFESIRSVYSGVESINITTPEKKYATVFEYYGHYDYNGDGIDEPIMASVLKDQRKLLRVVKWNRRRPFVLIEFSYILNRALGESVPEILKIIQQEVNTIWNQKTDAVTISNIPFFFFDPVAGYTPDDVKLAPGVGIPTNGPPSQAVYFPSMNITHPEMYREIESLTDFAERMMGASANIQGVDNPKRVTATEIATIDRRSNIRFLTIFERIKKGLRQIFKLALEYDREYMPKEIQVRITGLDDSAPVFETIERSALEAEFDIMVNGNSVLDEQAEQQQMFQAYQVGMMNPLIAKNETAIYELTRDLFSKLGVKRIDAYIHKPEDQIPKTPQEEHNLFLQEEYTDPHMAEDVQEHLKAHAEMINSKNFGLLTKRGKMLLLKHYQDTLRMQNQMEQWDIMNKLQNVNSQLMQLHMGQHPIQQQLQQPGQAPGQPPGQTAEQNGGQPQAGVPNG